MFEAQFSKVENKNEIEMHSMIVHVLIGSILISLSNSLTISKLKPSFVVPVISTKRPTICLNLSESNENNSPSKRSQRKRKRRKSMDSIVNDNLNDKEEEKEEQKEAFIQTTKSNQFVQMDVPDIRSISSKDSSQSMEYVVDDDEYEEDDDDNKDEEDSLATLLADAKRIRASSTKVEKEDEEINIGSTIKNVISTIVTIDFFVVFGLLLWFLSGIFSSYVLKNDAIQIAFNGIFEPIVQPALGILMIASAASGGKLYHNRVVYFYLSNKLLIVVCICICICICICFCIAMGDDKKE